MKVKKMKVGINLSFEYHQVNEIVNLSNKIINLLHYNVYNGALSIKQISRLVIDCIIYNIGKRKNMYDNQLLFEYDLSELKECVLYFVNKFSKEVKVDDLFQLIDKEISTSLHNIEHHRNIYCFAKVERMYRGLLLTLKGNLKYCYNCPSHVIEYMFKTIDSNVSNKLEVIFTVLYRYNIYGLCANNCLSYDDAYHFNNEALEMFANPINRHNKYFCSLFPDLEQYFGSIGSALTISPEQCLEYKSIIANPPYINSVMTELANKVVDILMLNKNFSFTIIVPDWRSTGFQLFDILEPYITELIIESPQYEYTDHMTGKKIAASTKGTLVIKIN